MSTNTGRVRRKHRVGAALFALLIVLGVSPSIASAHPLGNFSINHLNRLTFTADTIVNDVIVDAAEIPTAQIRPDVDLDGDDSISAEEAATHARNECTAFVGSATLTVDGVVTSMTVDTATFEYAPGQAGLETSRLDCRLTAPVGPVDGTPTSVVFEDGYLPNRLGWHEINAVGEGSTIVDSPVQETSVTDGLRNYPVELLKSPLDVRSASFDIEFGVSPDASGTTDDGVGNTSDATGGAGASNAADSRDSLVASRPGILGSFVDGVQTRFDDMIGRQDLTIGVGLLAIGLALLLGASHAVLPGHGKTVMAAYIAGKQGSVRDAVLVGFTVTATHTGGVLLLGLGLTLSTSLAGESVLGWLGVISGLLVAGLGLALLISAIRGRSSTMFGHGHTHGPGGHTHGPIRRLEKVGAVHSHADHSPDQGPGDHDHDDHGHDDHVHDHDDHSHGDHDHDDHSHGDHDHDHNEHIHGDHDHDHDHDDHDHGHDHGGDVPEHGEHGHDHGRQVSRRGLVGMGVAGGLVPSPSALIVLLSAIALGRTWFGVVLVVGYGVGMAATLTMAGILLVKIRDRYQGRTGSGSGRAGSAARWWGNVAPYLTASLVLIVGAGLAIRSLTQL